MKLISEVTHEDNMAFMSRYSDKFFDLSIVDPPYGIDINMNMGRKKGKKKAHNEKKWDNAIPTHEYFDELFRVSKNVIIWGGNYFPLPLTNSWIFWDKGVPEGVSFSDGELAWTSFDCVLRMAKIVYSGFRGTEGKIHPTQKPVKLYEWVLDKYGNGCRTVMDNYLGSGSSRIAAYNKGFDFYGCELDKEYFDLSNERFQKHINQSDFFAQDKKITTQVSFL